MNRRGFMGMLASIAASVGLGKIAGAAPKREPIKPTQQEIVSSEWRAYLKEAKMFIDLGGQVNEAEVRSMLGLPAPK